MNSLVLNDMNTISRRILLVIFAVVGLSALVFANTDVEAKLTRDEATKLISLVKEEFALDSLEPVLLFNEEGQFEELNPIELIKIYDSNNELLLEAPITKIEQASNKNLKKLLNASDFLTQFSHTKYYRLDI